MTPQTSPRLQRRRSSCPSFFWILVLAWAGIMAGSNLARVLMLPDLFVRIPQREEVPKPPNYYEILGVTPLVDDAKVRQMRRKYVLEFHPDKVGDDPEARDTFMTMLELFETLTDERRRCEYDKEHRIRGKWPVQTCRDAFREEYREINREMREKIWETRGDLRTREGHSRSEWSDPKDEPTSPPFGSKPRTPKTGKSRRTSDSHKASRLRSENGRPTGPGTGARPAVTVVATEVDAKAKDAVETVTSAVAQVLGGCAGVLVESWGYLYRYGSEVLGGFQGLMGILKFPWVFGR